jgi:hypothetical protein
VSAIRKASEERGMTASIRKALPELVNFERQADRLGKGQLALLLVLTEKAKSKRFPLNPDEFLSRSGGQVAGASGRAANKILEVHGVKARLSAEGGRTNRGSIALMRAYIGFLNSLHNTRTPNLNLCLQHWVLRTEELLAAAPLRARLNDHQISVRSIINDLIRQAKDRQKSRPGSTIVGTLMQHLTAAKLRCMLGENAPTPHGASDADSSRNTGGDFEIRDSVLHVTAAPAEPLLQKCKENLEAGKRPVIITLATSLQHAQSLAESIGLENRIEFWSLDQFLSANVHEWGAFAEQDVRRQLSQLLQAYNDIIVELHEEPSLKIDF